MKNTIIIITLLSNSIFSCKSQNSNAAVDKPSKLIMAYLNSMIVSNETIVDDLNLIIDTTFTQSDKIKYLSEKTIIVIIDPDSCGNIIDVGFSNKDNREENIETKVLLELKKYFFSLKKVNVYYKNENNKICFLYVVIRYLKFDKNGTLVRCHIK